MRIGDRLTPEQIRLLRNLPATETQEDREEVEREAEITAERFADANQSRRERFGRKKKETDT
jgi:hypothetical protein